MTAMQERTNEMAPDIDIAQALKQYIKHKEESFIRISKHREVD